MEKCEITGRIQEIYGENGVVYIEIKSDKISHTIYNAIHFKNVKLTIKEVNEDGIHKA